MTVTIIPPHMKPGRYLRMRREAADMSLRDVGQALIGAEPPRSLRNQLVALEMDEGFGQSSIILAERLRGIFPFDLAVYFALVGLQGAPDTPGPLICGQCGCSWNDACQSEAGPCAWAHRGAETPICTACQPAPAPFVPSPHAPETVHAH